jgi:hypothetical protein
MIFTRSDYDQLSCLFDPHVGYRGYKPAVLEVPNGDGKVDAQKSYLHVALKYDPPSWALAYLARAHFEACRVAEALGVDPAYYPRVADGTLRVNWYSEGAGSHEHTDFDLFTVNCFRETPDDLEAFAQYSHDAAHWVANPFDHHVGEIGALVGLGAATPHRVIARPYVQRSIVYFAMPDHAAQLPCQKPGSGTHTDCTPTVREWLQERYARSRVPARVPA